MKPLSKQSLLLILLGLLAIVTVGLFVMEKREEMPVVKTPPTPIEKDTENEEKETFTKYNKVLDRAKITGVEDLEGEYKKVTINNGEITFSFEVPDHWLTETRNSGEVEMNEEELREFLATRCIYEQETGDMYFEKKPSFSESEESSYTNGPQSLYKKLSLQELYTVYFSDDERFPSAGFPNVSIGSGCIGYSGPNGSQTDFYILSPDEADRYYDYNERQGVSDDLRDKGTVTQINIDGNDAISFLGDKTDLYGIGDTRRIFIPVTKESGGLEVIVIHQQSASYDDEVKQGFQHILDSLSIQNPLP